MGTGEGQRDDADARRLVRMLDASPYITVLLDGDGTVMWVSEAVERLFGYTVAEALGSNILDHVDTEWDPAALGSIAEAFAGEGLRLPAIFRGVHKDGSKQIYEAWASAQLHDPALQGMVVLVRRWDERVLLDLAFESLAAGEPLAVTLGLLVEVMASETLDAQGAVIHDLRSGRPAKVISHPDLPQELTTSDHRDVPWVRAAASGQRQTVAVDDLPEPVRSSARAAGHELCWAWPVPTAEGSGVDACLVAWRTSDAVDPDFTRTRLLDSLVRLAQLALERERTLARLEHAATHDALTSVANRARFYDELQAAVGDGADDLVAVLYLDLDHFKPVNDRLGHVAGDAVLQSVADRLRRAIRHGDLLARLGGDEFAVLCPHVREVVEVEQLAQRLVDVVAEPVSVRGDHVHLGASVGVSLGERGTDGDLLVEAADRALYHVKDQGKGGWSLEGPHGEPSMRTPTQKVR